MQEKKSPDRAIEKIVDSKRMVKNTIMLYFRMFFQMGVFLFTTRVLMKALGVEDYGLYDVVGGIVTMMIFLNNSMTVSTQRYITYALGKNDNEYLNKIYSICIQAHLGLGILIVVTVEAIGIWYINNYLNVPAERIGDAHFLLHCSLGSAFLMIVSAPYNSAIIAYERMTAFAYITILDYSLRLAIAIGISYYSGERLCTFTFAMVCEALLIRIIYSAYCSTKIKDLKFLIMRDWGLMREVVGFAGWSTLGNMALVAGNQGLNLILNAWGGTIMNAARGVAFQVQTAVTQFVASFQTAINPQITKSYAAGMYDEMHKMILRSSKFSFILLMCFALPLWLEMPWVLDLWLYEVPPHAVAFARLLLLVSMVDAIANPMMIGATATGRIKRYHITIGSILLLTVPIAYLAIRFTDVQEIVFVVLLAINIVAQTARVFLCQNMFGLKASRFLYEVLWPLAKTATAFLPLPCLCAYYTNGFIGIVFTTTTSLACIACATYYLALSEDERTAIIKITKSKLYI